MPNFVIDQFPPSQQTQRLFIRGIGITDARETFDDTSFSLIVEYDWLNDARVCAKVAQAYKSGGFNTRDPDPGFFAHGFDEEKNRSAELA